jgi:hypothetical protein
MESRPLHGIWLSRDDLKITYSGFYFLGSLHSMDAGSAADVSEAVSIS